MNHTRQTTFNELTEVMHQARLNSLIEQTREDESEACDDEAYDEQAYFDGPLTSLLTPSRAEARAVFDAPPPLEASDSFDDKEAIFEFDVEAITTVRPRPEIARLPLTIAPEPPMTRTMPRTPSKPSAEDRAPEVASSDSIEPEAPSRSEPRHSSPALGWRSSGVIWARVAALVIVGLMIG
jgi:hypothetical protein